MSESRKFNFKETFMSVHLWLYLVYYHLIIVIANAFVPKQTIINVRESFYSTEGIPLTPSYLPTIINVIIFDAVFVALFLIYNNLKYKRYHVGATILATFLSNLAFILYSQILVSTIIN